MSHQNSFAKLDKFRISTFLFGRIIQSSRPNHVSLCVPFVRIKPVKRCTLPFTFATFQTDSFTSVIAQAFLLIPKHLKVFSSQIEWKAKLSTFTFPSLHIIQQEMFKSWTCKHTSIIAMVSLFIKFVITCVANCNSHSVSILKHKFVDVMAMSFELVIAFYFATVNASVKAATRFAMMNGAISNAAPHFRFRFFNQAYLARDWCAAFHLYHLHCLDYSFYFNLICVGVQIKCHGDITTIERTAANATPKLQGQTNVAKVQASAAAQEGSHLGGITGVGGTSESCELATESEWQPRLQI